MYHILCSFGRDLRCDYYVIIFVCIGNKDLLLVAHGSSLDTNSRQLLGSPIRTEQEMYGCLRGIPYCGVAVMEQGTQTQKWSLAYLPKLHICHASVHDFDARKSLCGW